MNFYYLTRFAIAAGALLLSFAALAQSTATARGSVIDGYGDPLVGATVRIMGTTVGTVTDLDGAFEITGDLSRGLRISYIGHEAVELDEAAAIGPNLTITLPESAAGLEEVVVTGTMDIVRDRRTPVAVSTIGLTEIQEKGGNVEFPDLLKNTPSIYVAGQAGGYGEAQVFTRGFDQTNTAFLLNGQPINGMEDGRMYWSNWSGMMDIATAVQVQRGLGSSKLAISSVGGTTNIVMRSTAVDKGGSVGYTLGNDGYNKVTASYSTGLIDDKFGVTALLTHWQGNGWADGTEGAGQNYFLSAGYRPSANHDINFLITGAPQYHDQNFNQRLSSFFVGDASEPDIKRNANWGTYRGEYLSVRRNYYHKPVANLNWDWTLSPTASLSTVLYGSWGRGGGTGPLGRGAQLRDDDGQIDFDAIEAENIAGNGDPDSPEYVIRASVNNHSWYGAVSRLEVTPTEELSLSIGGDVRSYRGDHFRQLTDLLGAESYSQRGSARYDDREVTATFTPGPWAALNNYAEGEQRVAYSNAETIRYAGVFGQAEYTLDQVTAYVQGAYSVQNHVRFEQFNEEEVNEESEQVSNNGYNLKGGLSYAIGDHHVVFANAGIYSRQPFHDNIFLNFSNQVNPVTENERVVGLEAGYKLTTRDVTANVNVYRTSWQNRTRTSTITDMDTVNSIPFPLGGFANITDLDQLHTGVELDFRYRANRQLSVRGFASVGNWVYDGNANQQLFDNDRNLVETTVANDIDGVHVGGSAQTTAGLGLILKPMARLRINVDGYHYSRLYALPRSVNTQDDELELPAFNLFDLGAGYSFDLGSGKTLRLRANVYNVLGTEYIARATSAIAPSDDPAENYDGVNRANFVQFGTTQTWNVGARFSF